MTTRKKQPAANSKTGFVIGSERFAKISAVEGIYLDPTTKKRANEVAQDMNVIEFIYPLEPDQSYTIGQLRYSEARLLKERQSDPSYSSRLRIQERRDIEWAKSRNEECYALLLLVNNLGLKDTTIFRFCPDKPADFVVDLDDGPLNLQCTMAYAKGGRIGGKRHL